MTAQPAAIVDTATVTSTQGVVDTKVASTQQLLAGVPGPAAPPAQKAAQQLAMFKTNNEVLTYGRLVVRQYLGYKSTEVWAFADSQKHTPTPHIGLKDCGFGAWTNSSTRVYVFDPQLQQVLNAATGEEQRVLVWIVLYHETLHVKHFKSVWKGRPPSYTAGFKHEADTYKKSAKWLRNPNDRRFTVLLKDKAAKAACRTAAKQHEDISDAMLKAIAAAPSDPAKREVYFYDLLKADTSVPPALHNLPPAQALKASYGY